MPFVPVVVLAALIKKFGDWIKQITNRDVNGAITQVVMWLVGIGGTWLASGTTFANEFGFGNHTLDNVNGKTIVFLGLAIGSGASVFHDYLQARDNTNTTTVAHLKLLPRARTVVHRKETAA